MFRFLKRSIIFILCCFLFSFFSLGLLAAENDTGVNWGSSPKLVVPGEKIKDVGETASIYDGEKTVLKFDDEESAETALDMLSDRNKDAFADEVFSADDILCGDISWGTAVMGMDRLKTSSFSGKATVAIVDTGLYTGSPLFSGKTISSKSCSLTDNNGKIVKGSYITEGNWGDKSVHGTHLAGVIADATPSNIVLMPIRIFDSKGNTTALVVNEAVKYAVENGADVINLSFGLSGNQDFLDSVLAEAKRKGILVIAASGNSAGQVAYPASNVNTIAAGSVDKSFKVPSYSNYGSRLDFVAPGEEVVSAGKGNQYVKQSGTSVSAAHISAAAAYLKLKYPSMSFSDLYGRMRSYSVDLYAKGWDEKSGWGYVNLSGLSPAVSVKSLSPSDFSLSQTSLAYTGKALYPGYASGLNSSSYSVSYSDNVRPGTASIIFKGKSGYEGTVTKTFKIVDNTSVSFPSLTVQYDGNYHHPVVSGNLPSGVSASYTSYRDPGTYKVSCTLTDSLGIYKALYSYLTIKDSTSQDNNTGTGSVISAEGITSAKKSSKPVLKIIGPGKVKAGKKIRLKTNAKNIYKKNLKVKWSVSGRKYASINKSGILKTKKKGKKTTVVVTAFIKGKRIRKKIRII